MAHSMPDEWKPALRAYLRKRGQEERDTLRPTDFTDAVSVRLPDGFVVTVNAAIYLVDPARDQLLVFSERYGPQVFRLTGLQVTTMPAVPAARAAAFFSPGP